MGCGNNKSAEKLNEVFASIAERFTLNISTDLVNPIKTQMVATFNQQTGEQVDTTAIVKEQLEKINAKLQNLEDRFIDEDLTKNFT